MLQLPNKTRCLAVLLLVLPLACSSDDGATSSSGQTTAKNDGQVSASAEPAEQAPDSRDEHLTPVKGDPNWKEGSTREEQPVYKWKKGAGKVWKRVAANRKNCTVGAAGCDCTPTQGCDPGNECYWDLCFGPGFPVPQTYRYTPSARMDYYLLKRLILRNIELKPGMRIADIGAGRGNYSFEMVKEIGDDGVIYATDIDPGAIRQLKRKEAERGKVDGEGRLKMILVKKGRGTGLESMPVKHLDWILMINSVTFQKKMDREADETYLRSLVKHLKPGGVLLYHMDWQEAARSLTKKEVVSYFTNAGFAKKYREVLMPSHMPKKTFYLTKSTREKRDMVIGYILLFHRPD